MPKRASVDDLKGDSLEHIEHMLTAKKQLHLIFI